MNKQIGGLIIGLLAGLVLGGAAGYFIANNFHRNNFQGRPNLQIDDNTKNQIASFFGSMPSTDEIQSYCQQNRTYCVYYCSTVSPSDEICKSIMNFSRTGGRQYGTNN